MDSVEMQANNINMSVGKCKATLKQNKKMEFLFIFLEIIKYRQHLTCFDYLYLRATALERHSRYNRIK